MIPMTSWTDATTQTDGIAGERRYDRRYDIELEVRWKLLRRRKVVDTGTGRTVDLSSGGILFEAGRALTPGLDVELHVSWPVLLHDVAPLQLVVMGRIVRSDERHVALRTIQHEFRTMASSPEHRQTQAPGIDRGFRQ
jgi:hypothetical protein